MIVYANYKEEYRFCQENYGMDAKFRQEKITCVPIQEGENYFTIVLVQ